MEPLRKVRHASYQNPWEDTLPNLLIILPFETHLGTSFMRTCSFEGSGFPHAQETTEQRRRRRRRSLPTLMVLECVGALTLVKETSVTSPHHTSGEAWRVHHT